MIVICENFQCFFVLREKMDSILNKIKKYFIPAFMLVYSATAVMWVFIRIIFSNHELFGKYIYPNRLINYRAGFIRRGLGGEIIFRLSSFFNISLVQAIDFSSAVIWIMLVMFFYKKFVQKKYPVFILALPFLLGETILVDESYFLRHDSLILLIFIAMTYILTKKIFPQIVSFLLINLLFIFGILFHEAIFFFSFPILLLTLWHKTDSLMKSFLFFLPALVVFCLCFVVPDKSTAVEMLKLSPEINSRYIVCFASFAENLALQWLKTSEISAFATLLYLLISVPLIYFLSINFDKFRFNIVQKKPVFQCLNCDFLSSILILQLVSLSPLFFCALDWGRWIFLWTASSFAYFLVAEENPFGKMPKIFLKPNLLATKLRNVSPQLVFCVAIFTGLQFGLPLKFDLWSWNMPVLIIANTVKEFLRFFTG